MNQFFSYNETCPKKNSIHLLLLRTPSHISEPIVTYKS